MQFTFAKNAISNTLINTVYDSQSIAPPILLATGMCLTETICYFASNYYLIVIA